MSKTDYTKETLVAELTELRRKKHKLEAALRRQTVQSGALDCYQLEEGKFSDDIGRLSSILDSLDAVVYVADMYTYEVLYVNYYTKKIFGEILGKTCWKTFQKGQDGPCEFCTNHLILDAEGKPTGVHSWEFRNTATNRWFLIKDRAIRWSDGRFVRLEIAYDITERMMVEDLLKQSEERFRAIFEGAAIGIALVDRSGRPVVSNSSLQGMMGYSAEELKAKVFTEFTHPDDAEKDMILYVELVEGKRESYQMEKRYIRKDGQIIWGELNVSGIRDEHGDLQYAIGMVKDITRRKYAEEALINAREELELKVDERTAELRKANRELISSIEKHIRTEEALGWELSVNKALRELSASLLDRCSSLYDTSSVTLKFAKTLTGSDHGYVSSIDPDTGDNISHTLTDMMEDQCNVTGKDRRIVFPKGPDGRYPTLWGHALNTKLPFFTNEPSIHHSSKGLPVGHISIQNFLSVPAIAEGELMGQIALANSSRDYTEQDLEAVTRLAELYALAIQRKHSEETLTEQEEKLRLLLNSTAEGIFGLDIEGNCTFCNTAALRILGYMRKDDILGKNMHDLVHYKLEDGLALRRDDCRIIAALRKEEQIHVDSDFFTRSNGEAFSVEYWSYPMYRGAEHVGAVVTFMDISDRKRAEQAIFAYKEKLSALALELSSAEERERRNIADDIHDHIGQTLAMAKIRLRNAMNSLQGEAPVELKAIGNLLEQAIVYTRSLVFELSPLGLLELGFEEAVEWAIEQIMKNHGLIVRLTVSGKSRALSSEKSIVMFKAVRELLLNTVKHSGTIKAWVTIDYTGNGLAITVKDQGKGFTPDTYGRSRVDKMCFGLFNISERIQSMGGSMDIRSAPGDGTEVSAWVPIP